MSWRLICANSCRNTWRSSSRVKLDASPVGKSNRGRTKPNSVGLLIASVSISVTGVRTPISALQSSSKLSVGSSINGRCRATPPMEFVMIDNGAAHQKQERPPPTATPASIRLPKPSERQPLRPFEMGASIIGAGAVSGDVCCAAAGNFKTLKRLAGEGIVHGNARRSRTRSHSAQRQRGCRRRPQSHCAASTSTMRIDACPDIFSRPGRWEKRACIKSV